MDSRPGDHGGPVVRRVRDASEAGDIAAGLLIEAASRAVAESGRFTLAIPGGSSPKGVFEALVSSDAFPWPKTDLLWVDERAVPPEHADSNYGAFARDILPRLPIDSGRVHPMRGELGAEAGASDYANVLGRVLGNRPLDAVLLGIGEDGHVASLFPDSPALKAEGLAIPIFDSPKPPPERITLTLPVLRGARVVILLGLGGAKRDAVERALAGEPLPARLVGEGPGSVWLTDTQAAAWSDRA